MSVESRRFYGPAQPGTIVTALVSPAAGTAILVKEITVVADGAAACPVDFYVNNGAVRARYIKTNVGGGLYLLQECRLYLAVGDVLEANRVTAGTSCKVTVNGFLFDPA